MSRSRKKAPFAVTNAATDIHNEIVADIFKVSG